MKSTIVKKREFALKYKRVKLLFLIFITISTTTIYANTINNLKHALAQQEYKNKNYKEALERFKKLPRDNTTLFEIASTLYRLGRYKEAIAYYKMVNSASLQGLVYYNLANCYYKLGNYKMASRLYKGASKFKKVSKKAIKNLKISKKKEYFAKAAKIKECKGKQLSIGDEKAKLDDFNDPFVSSKLILAKLKELDKSNTSKDKSIKLREKINTKKVEKSKQKSNKIYNSKSLQESRIEQKIKNKKIKTLLIPIE